MVGPGAVVAAGTEVVDSVVMAGARIAGGSRVERSVIGARSSVGESCELTELTVVGYDHDIAAGTVARGGCFPDPDTW